jgi:hypothetical protein
MQPHRTSGHDDELQNLQNVGRHRISQVEITLSSFVKFKNSKKLILESFKLVSYVSSIVRYQIVLCFNYIESL